MLNKFSLRLSLPEYDSHLVKGCIAFATQYGVKKLKLDFPDPTWNDNSIFYNVHNAFFELPTDVYKHTCQESLKFFSCSFIESELVKFRALKEVSLGYK
jgi:hypothetical protein